MEFIDAHFWKENSGIHLAEAECNNLYLYNNKLKGLTRNKKEMGQWNQPYSRVSGIHPINWKSE